MITNSRTVLVLFFLTMLSIGLLSCEKEVKLDLKDSGKKLVVEGSIETGMPPIIYLSNSIGFFSNIDLKTLSEAFVHDAVIKVSDGVTEITLKEYEIKQGGFSSYFYTIDTNDFNAMQFIGIPGKTYSLSIQTGDKIYTSTTSIPFVKPIDSIWSIAPSAEEIPEKYPDARRIYIQYTDPDTLGNSVRYFTKRNNEPFLTAFSSVFDDEIVNGTTVSIPLTAGYPKMDTIDFQKFGWFFKGDTVTIKWSGIDKATYDFWSTLEFSFRASGNPFASPIEVSTNIKGGALGIWGGYSSSYKKIIISQ